MDNEQKKPKGGKQIPLKFFFNVKMEIARG